jgi:hypothetical protein
MKSLLLAAVYNALRAYAGSGVFNRIVAHAMLLMSDNKMTGQEKMATVIAFANQEALNLSTTLVRAIVEIFLLKYQEA